MAGVAPGEVVEGLGAIVSERLLGGGKAGALWGLGRYGGGGGAFLGGGGADRTVKC